jgi:undecaprenyl pyrophosphate synthase
MKTINVHGLEVRVYNETELRAIHKERFPEGKFFDRKAMEMFRTSVGSGYSANGGKDIFFVTKDGYPDDMGGRIGYTVRHLRPSGVIMAVGNFAEYDGRAEATAYAKTLATSSVYREVDAEAVAEGVISPDLDYRSLPPEELEYFVRKAGGSYAGRPEA